MGARADVSQLQSLEDGGQAIMIPWHDGTCLFRRSTSSSTSVASSADDTDPTADEPGLQGTVTLPVTAETRALVDPAVGLVFLGVDRGGLLFPPGTPVFTGSCLSQETVIELVRREEPGTGSPADQVLAPSNHIPTFISVSSDPQPFKTLCAPMGTAIGASCLQFPVVPWMNRAALTLCCGS